MTLEQILANLGIDAASSNALGQAQGTPGVIVWWNIGPATCPEPLQDLNQHWFKGSRFDPKPRSWTECLMRALREDYPAGKYLIHTTKVASGELAAVEVRQMIKGVQENQLPRVLRAHINEGLSDDNHDAHVYTLEDGEVYPQDKPLLADKVQLLRGSLCAKAVGEWLVQIVLSPLIGGARLNVGGGNYFIPQESLDRLETIRQTVVPAADVRAVPGTRNRITASRVEINPDLLADIQEGLEHQIQAKLENIRQVATSGVGLRALRNRQQEAEELLAHLEKYKSILAKQDVAAIDAQITDAQVLLGIELARAEGKAQADGGAEELDAMLGV